MNILTEIIEASDEMVDALSIEGFFNEQSFIKPSDLRNELQIQMQRNWEQDDFLGLSDTQFEDICKMIVQDRIGIALSDLVQEGYVQSAVNPDGEIVYSLTDKPFEL
jgi:hypothetical protein